MRLVNDEGKLTQQDKRMEAFIDEYGLDTLERARLFALLLQDTLETTMLDLLPRMSAGIEIQEKFEEINYNWEKLTRNKGNPL